MKADFNLRQDGNFEGATVLQRQRGGKLSELSETALEKLFVLRYGDTTETITKFQPAKNNDEAKGND